MEIMSNVHLNTNFQSLARELDIMEPKVIVMLFVEPDVSCSIKWPFDISCCNL